MTKLMLGDKVVKVKCDHLEGAMEIETLIPLRDAAKRTALSESGIRRGLKDGSIKGFKVARDWVLEPEEVNRLAAEYPLPQAGATEG